MLSIYYKGSYGLFSFRQLFMVHSNVVHFRQNSNTRSRHMKAVKIGLSLFMVFILSNTPFLYTVTFREPISGYFRFAIYINNLANFFIYLFVDEEFRAKLKKMCESCR